jgi:dihydrofolate reductase
MGRIIVVSFVSLDGVVTDPDGSAGTPAGGWAWRFGPELVGGDKFRLGPILDTGTIVLGRSTWELLGQRMPSRTDDFSVRMTKIRKLVASRSLTDVSAWENSVLIDGEVADAVRTERETRDVVVVGSLSVVRALQESGLVDEYRLMTFPSILGAGERLFPATGTPVHLELISMDQVGPTVLATYRRSEGQG